MGLFEDLYPTLDIGPYLWQIFIFCGVIAGFFAGLYLLFSGKSRILGLALVGGCGLYAFFSWG